VTGKDESERMLKMRSQAICN